MNLRRMFRLGVGAAPGEIDGAAWEQYLLGLKANLDANTIRAREAYVTLRQVRETLGLPFIAAGAPESGGAPGMSSKASWSASLDQDAVDIVTMAGIVSVALDDAAAGKRRLMLNANGEFAIESLTDDPYRLELQANGTPVIVSAQSGSPVHPTGTVGIPSIVWLATATVSVLALPVYWAVDKAVNNIRDVAEQKTMQTIVEKGYDCIANKNCSPDQVAAINNSVYKGAAEVNKSRAEVIAAGKPTDIGDAITKVGLIALGLGLLYAAIRFIPPASSRSPSTALAVR